jgi:N-acetylglutamate synthase-like GNAT family acetyltransferase
MSSTIVRVAVRKDAEAIARLVNLAFLAERMFIGSDRTNPDGVRNLLAKGEFLLLEDAETLIGCVYLEPRGDSTYLGLLAVEPGKQTTGLGSQLMSAAEARCRTAGRRAMELTVVNRRTDLLRFYGKRGYVETGTEPFPAPDRMKVPVYLIRMEKPLSD